MARISDKTKNLSQSGIRSASSRCAAVKGINLGQGICDIAMNPAVKQAALDAINNDKNIYSACEGLYPLRQAVADKLEKYNHIKADPKTEIMISHGATGAYYCALMTLFNSNDEIILFEPFYGYHQAICKLQGLQVKTVTINPDDFSINLQEVAAAIGPRTKAIVVCSPNNPTGKVFSKQELSSIGSLAKQHNLWVITDEIYEYITYPGYEHISLASLEDFHANTITISGFSKTYNMTGWRLGYATGPADIINKMSLVQDLTYVCPVTPLQHAVIAALQLPQDYYKNMQHDFLAKRDFMVKSLTELGFKVTLPQGAYYLLADFSELGFKSDEAAADFLITQAKAVVVPGRYFMHDSTSNTGVVRFCYALDQAKLELALNQIKQAMVGHLPHD